MGVFPPIVLKMVTPQNETFSRKDAVCLKADTIGEEIQFHVDFTVWLMRRNRYQAKLDRQMCF